VLLHGVHRLVVVETPQMLSVKEAQKQLVRAVQVVEVVAWQG